MTREPHDRALQALRDVHSAGRTEVFVHACADALGVDGVCLSLCADGGVREIVVTTDLYATRLETLSSTLGEGPAHDSLAMGAPVLVGQLSAHAERSRWPSFSLAALELGVAAVFAFPLQVGAVGVGLLSLHRRSHGDLTEAQAGEARSWQGAALSLILHEQEASDGPALPESLAPRWSTSSVVHQATGMVMVQLGTDVRSAFATLRARAYGDGVTLEDIARDIVSRRLRFGGPQ